MQGNRAEFYRQTISKLISGLDPDDSGGRSTIYARMRNTNEGYIEKNRDRLSDVQIQSMRDQLDQAIDETERSLRPVTDDLSDLPDEGTADADSLAIPDGMTDPLTVDYDGDPFAAAPRKDEAEEGATLPPPPEAALAASAASPKSFWRGGRFAVGLLLGLILGGAMAYGAGSFLPRSTAVAGDAETVRRHAAFEAAFQQSRALAEKEIELLQRMEAALLEQQKNDGAALAQLAGKKYQKVADVLPAFSNVREETGDGALDVLVRADENDYKIRFNSPVCATVRFIRPDLIDTRFAEEGVGCRFFGAWSEGGAAF